MASNFMASSCICSLCAGMYNSDQMTLIFGPVGVEKKLNEKVNLYTPFKIKETDVSKAICNCCQNNLEAWDAYMKYCIQAQETLISSGGQNYSKLTETEAFKIQLVAENQNMVAESYLACSATPASRSGSHDENEIKITNFPAETSPGTTAMIALESSKEREPNTTGSQMKKKHNLKARGTYCCALWCNNNFGKNPNLSLFRIPKDKLRALQWLTNAGREDLLHKGADFWHFKYLCEKHFTENMFMNSKRNKLIWNAVPTIFPEPQKNLIKSSQLNCNTEDAPGSMLQIVSKPVRNILPKPLPEIEDSFPVSCNDFQDTEQFCYDIISQESNLTSEQNTSQPSVSGKYQNKTNVSVENTSSQIVSNQSSASDTASVVDSGISNPKCDIENLYLDYPYEETNEKRYPCTFCGEMFLFKNSLFIHQTTYHSYIPFCCEQCGKELDSSGNEFVEHKCEQQASNKK